MNLNNLSFEEIFTKVDYAFESNIPFLMKLGENSFYRFYSGIKSILLLYSDIEFQLKNIINEDRSSLTPEQMAVIYDSMNQNEDPCDNCGMKYSWVHVYNEYEPFDGKLCSFCRLVFLHIWESRIHTLISDGSDEADIERDPLERDLYVTWFVNKDLDKTGKIQNGVEIFKTRFPSELINIVRKTPNLQLYHESKILPVELVEVAIYGRYEDQIDALEKIDDVQDLIHILQNIEYSITPTDQSKTDLIAKIIEKIKDEDKFKEILSINMNENIQKQVITKIQDSRYLEKMAVYAVDSNVRKLAIQQIDNLKIWMKVALGDSESSVRTAAVERIDDDDILYDICLNDTHFHVIRTAVNQMNDEAMIFKVLLIFDKLNMEDTKYHIIEAAVVRLKNNDKIIKQLFHNPDISLQTKRILHDKATVVDKPSNPPEDVIDQSESSSTLDEPTDQTSEEVIDFRGKPLLRTEADLIKLIEKETGELPFAYEIKGNTLGLQIKDNQIVGIGLYNKQLETLPMVIGYLPNLQHLNLSNNQLTSLPVSIGNLNNLKVLTLTNNDLTSLPESIGELINLERISLSGANSLKFLPESIGDLIKLQRLTVYGSGLSSLPETIGKLTNLVGLNIQHSKLDSLPESIGNLSSLKSLNLSFNELTLLPTSIGNLTKLASLELSNNKITGLPDTIGNLIGLDHLSLSNNKITILPKNIGNLMILYELFLEKNLLTSIPKSIGKIKGLDILHLGDNRLTSIPKSIGDLLNLTDLVLRNNKLKSIPSSVRNLQRLRFLDLDGNDY